MHFGATLRLLRMESGISLRALAQRVGVSGAYLSRVENGHDPAPTPDRLIAIAEAIGVPAAVLLDLAQQTGTAVSGYLQRVPAASALFLDIAERDLGSAQIARIKAFIDAEFPVRRGRPGAGGVTRLRDLLTPSRVVLKLACSQLDDLIDVAVSRLPAAPGLGPREMAARIRAREREAPSVVGGGLAVPHGLVPGAPPAAALVTLARPLAVDTPDGQPVAVALVVVWGEAGRRNLELIARAARLASSDVAEELRAATTPARALSVLERAESLW
ncbi:MAG TPA: helix-turn-helix domain-containing protein [Kofleriaceae bacterium]|nr:helix-turn-helix domain-containing protein [Kofleriaceae bacterium]